MADSDYYRFKLKTLYPFVDEYKLDNRERRAYRLLRAKAISTHSKLDWLEMKDFFENTCAKCFGESGLKNVEKDHIVPLFIEGSSDGLENIQPLCALCNSSKSGTIDYRPQLAQYLNKSLPKKYTNKWH